MQLESLTSAWDGALFFFDCNNDGAKDIYLANDSQFGVNGQSTLPNWLYMNNGDGSFSSGNYTGDVQNDYGTYGAAYTDFDQDGHLDIAMANHGTSDGNQIFRNQGTSGNFVSIRLVGTTSNSHAIGARMILHTDQGKTQSAYVTAGSGYVSQNSPVAHFGIGNANEVDSLTLIWPTGTKQTVRAIALNTLNVVVESTSIARNQMVWTEPAFPTQENDIKVYFNAA